MSLSLVWENPIKNSLDAIHVKVDATISDGEYQITFAVELSPYIGIPCVIVYNKPFNPEFCYFWNCTQSKSVFVLSRNPSRNRSKRASERAPEKHTYDPVTMVKILILTSQDNVADDPLPTRPY